MKDRELAKYLDAIRDVPSHNAEQTALSLARFLQELDARQPRITIVKQPWWHRFLQLFSLISIFRHAPNFAIALLMVLLVLIPAAGGTAYSAQRALPGDGLYPAKLAIEEVQLAFSFQDVEKTLLHTEFANRRLAEVKTLME